MKMAIRHFGPLTEPQTANHTCWDTYLQISLMVTDIQHISHFRWNLQSFAFSITGAVSLPILVGLLASGLKTCGHITESNYPKPHLTFLVMSF